MSNYQFSEDEQLTLKKILQSRRDVRGNRFLSTPIPEEQLQKIFAAASWAPSVGLSQPWEFILVNEPLRRQEIVANFKQQNELALKQFDEKQKLYHQLKLEGILESPVNIAIFYRPSAKPVLGQTSMEETGRYSVVCAIQNMWLMARALNIGLGWVSILDPKAVKKTLNAPKNVEFIAYLCLGYVNEFLDSPELETLGWEERKPVEQVVFENQFPIHKDEHIAEDL